jgi:NAD(P)-dependent dehydrogenase (short-subunit alcohol dehydrogenase family)
MTEQQVILITGASSGFGLLMAQTFARAEDAVFAGMRGIADRNAKPRADLEALGVEVLELDVTNDEQVEAAVARVIERRGQIDVLINNAGIGLSALSECSSLEQVRRVFEANYFGPLRLCRAVLPHMRRRKSGFLVHMSSIAGCTGLPNSAYYGGAKASLQLLGEVQRYELASFGIDVSVVQPGMFATPIFDVIGFADDVARAAEYGPIGEKPALGIAMAKQMLAGGTPDPQEVADVVFGLTRLPAGQRPLHVPIGQDAQALVPINALKAQFSDAMFKAFGFI